MRTVRNLALSLVLAAASSPVLALDPTLILLRILRDQFVTAAAEAGFNALREMPAARPAIAEAAAMRQPLTDPGQLKRVIDEAFVYLPAEQRLTIHASLIQMLGDPRNAGVRSEIVDQFVQRAAAVRHAYLYLDGLPPDGKRAVAGLLGSRLRSLSDDERREVVTALESGGLPVPRDLTQMMLAELRAGGGMTPLAAPAGVR